MKAVKDNKNKSGQGKNSIIQTLAAVFILLLGIGVMVYPSFSNWWNSMHQSRAIASYITTVDNLDEQEARELIESARKYNATLINKQNVFAMKKEDLAEYNSLLDLTGTGIMGYIRIESIGVDLPIYHGTEETVLQVAVGHVNWTSLPVGGEGTHTVLSGHRGLPRARLFTDLDRLVPGDVFTITILKETLTYMVDQIKVVLPEETDDILIEPGMDYCTLITCTPYGINTHRMLVRGHRVENIAVQHEVESGAERVSNLGVFSVVAIPIMFLGLLSLIVYDYVELGPVPSRKGYSFFEIITGNGRKRMYGRRKGRTN